MTNKDITGQVAAGKRPHFFTFLKKQRRRDIDGLIGYLEHKDMSVRYKAAVSFARIAEKGDMKAFAKKDMVIKLLSALDDKMNFREEKKRLFFRSPFIYPISVANVVLWILLRLSENGEEGVIQESGGVETLVSVIENHCDSGIRGVYTILERIIDRDPDVTKTLVANGFLHILMNTVERTCYGGTSTLERIIDQDPAVAKTLVAEGLLPILMNTMEKNLGAGASTMEKIAKAVDSIMKEDDGLARQIELYLCHRYTDIWLREIGNRFDTGESTVSQNSRRFSEKLKKDRKLYLSSVQP